MKSSIWLCTRNNPEIFGQDYLESFYTKSKARYVCGQLEKGAEGTLHIQFYVNYENPVRITALQKVDKQAHYEKVKFDNGAARYCMKEDTRIEGPWEFGKKPIERNNKHDWEEVKQLAIAGDFDKIPAEIYIKHMKNLKQIHQENIKVQNHEQCRGIWLWGPPGTGKTTFARTEYGEDVYIKAQNKWWDGYKGQKVVILDDLDTDCLAHYLKIWADKWGATGEIKGGTVALTYDTFIVTSNYSIDQLFTKDEQLREAIRRRFKVTHFNKPLGAE